MKVAVIGATVSDGTPLVRALGEEPARTEQGRTAQAAHPARADQYSTAPSGMWQPERKLMAMALSYWMEKLDPSYWPATL